MRVLCENAASTELRLKAGLGVPSLRAQQGCGWGHSRRHSWSASPKASHMTGGNSVGLLPPAVLNALTVPLSLPTMDTLYAMSAL